MLNAVCTKIHVELVLDTLPACIGYEVVKYIGGF